MSLKEKLEFLRGGAIRVFDGNSMDIPCIETSDAKKLCKHPVVSIHMITYNHEPYIRQAIEGVVMQNTDFDFELVIGEDASQDKTREICLEYQKQYPGIIRVLWWHENVTRFGGNFRRVIARCRGDFIAFCEGDDYWTDPLKLQKQIDIMRRHPDVGICFARVKALHQETGRTDSFKVLRSLTGKINGRDFMLAQLNGAALHGQSQGMKFRFSLQTSSMLFRCSVNQRASQKYEISSWRLSIADVVFRLLLASESNVYILPDQVSVYRIHSGGVTSQNFTGITCDDCITRVYFSVKALGMSLDDAIQYQAKSVVRTLVNLAATKRGREQREVATRIIRGRPIVRKLFHSLYALPLYGLIRIGLMRPRIAYWLNRIYWYMPRFWIFR